MSAEAIGWVFKKSPYEGAMFALHLAVGDVVNDANDNQLWIKTKTLAAKARVSERSARSGLDRMVADGLLELIAERPGTTTIYRFLTPEDPCNQCTPATSAPLQVEPEPLQSDARPLQPVQATPAATAAITKEELKRSQGEPKTLVGFDAFMRVYPKSVAVGKARKEWAKAIRKKNPADIIIAAQAYRDDPQRKPRYTMSPATWLEGECWDDDRTPERTRSNGTKAASGLIARAGSRAKELSA